MPFILFLANPIIVGKLYYHNGLIDTRIVRGDYSPEYIFYN